MSYYDFFERSCDEVYGLLENAAEYYLKPNPVRRPRNSSSRPGSVFRFGDHTEKAIFIGDLHPDRNNFDNFRKLTEKYLPGILKGNIGLVVGGDFTHPGTGDLTEMESSLKLLTDYLLPLKLKRPDNVVLLRGDHESVGSPYGPDFGKSASFIPQNIAGDDLAAFLDMDMIWVMSPELPQLQKPGNEFNGLFSDSPEAIQFSFSGFFLRETLFQGEKYVFSRIEGKAESQVLIFRHYDNPERIKKIFVKTVEGKIYFLYKPEEGKDETVACSLAVNQSRLYGKYVSEKLGKEWVERLQKEIYDRLPIIAVGRSFAAVHAGPLHNPNGKSSSSERWRPTLQDIIDLEPSPDRTSFSDPWLQLTFGRPAGFLANGFTPEDVRSFLEILNLEPHHMLLAGHTIPKSYVSNIPRDFPYEPFKPAPCVVLPFGVKTPFFLVDSQDEDSAAVVMQNRTFEKTEDHSPFWNIIQADEPPETNK